MPPFENIQIASPAFKADPHAIYARLRADAPVCRVRLPDKQEAWLVTRYDDVLTLLKDRRFVKEYRNAAPPGDRGGGRWVPPVFAPLLRNMLDLDDPDHSRLKMLVHKAFTPQRVERMTGRIQALSDALLDKIEARSEFDLIRDFASPLPVTVIADLLGVPESDRSKFARWSNTIIKNTASPWDMVFALPDMLAFVRFLKRLARQRRADPQDDLVSALTQAGAAGEALSEDELMAMIALLLTAGHETTVNLIGNGMLALLQNPEELARLHADPTQVKTAVEEMLRYVSPVDTTTSRYAREDMEFAGAQVPRGTLIIGAIGSANRDERQFPTPNAFDIARDPNKHLTFGQGGHYCVGAPLARMEGQIAINALLQRFPHLELAQPVDRLRWRRGLVLRGLESLPLRRRGA